MNDYNPIAEIDALRKHKDKLLGELKAAKAKLREADERNDEMTVQITELQKQNELSQEQVKKFAFEKPVDELLQHMFIVDAQLSRQQIELYYDIKHLGDGEISITDKEGEPLIIVEEIDGRKHKRHAQFNEGDLFKVFADSGKFDRILISSRASGGGGSSSYNYSIGVFDTVKPDTKGSNKAQFGLR